MKYVVRNTERFAAVVSKAKREISFHRPIIAIQIRHGDACVVRSGCFSMDEYMAQAQRMKDKYGVTNIYLATDSYR